MMGYRGLGYADGVSNLAHVIRLAVPHGFNDNKARFVAQYLKALRAIFLLALHIDMYLYNSKREIPVKRPMFVYITRHLLRFIK